MLRWLLTSCLLGLALAATQEMTVEYSIGTESATMSVSVDRDNNAIQYHLPEADWFEEVEMFEDYDSGYAASKVVAADACFVQMLEKTLDEQVQTLEEQQNYPITESVNTTAIPISDEEESDIGDRIHIFCDGLPIYEMIFNDDIVRDDSSSDERGRKRGSSSSESDESSSESDESSSESDESDSDSDESSSGSDSDEDDSEDAQEEPTQRSLRFSSDDFGSYETGTEYRGSNRQVSVTYRRCVVLFFVAKCFVTTLTIPTGSTITFSWLILG